ncbi:MAG: CPBP family intramembrane metalloprotease [Acidobacteriota bacterium]|nr:CPBP family intramembrane metalloprotease [Acidobacteriota bacterium]
MNSNEPPQIVPPTPTWPAPPPTHDNGTSPFTGRFGLRAIWGILIFIALFAALSFGLSVATRVAEGKTPIPKKSETAKRSTENMNARGAFIGDAEGFAAAALTALILCRIERRRIGVYGIGRNRLRDFLPGAFWGLATLSLLVGTLWVTHVLVFDGRALTGSAIFLFGAKWLAAFLCVGLAEEYTTRGYLQYTLTRGFFTMAERISPTNARAIAFWAAAVFMSILFGAGHLFNPGESASGIIAVFLAGMTFSYALWHTGSLWWAIGFHMAWDWAQSFLYGVPDSGFLSGGRLFNTHPTGNPLLSGGTDGPEGSIFVIPTLLLVIAIIRFTTRRGEQPPLEPILATHSLPQEPLPVIA